MDPQSAAFLPGVSVVGLSLEEAVLALGVETYICRGFPFIAVPIRQHALSSYPIISWENSHYSVVLLNLEL